MDAIAEERGQALVIAALLLAIAAVAIAGLRASQDRILERARERRAGEAAVEAATALVADAYVAELRRVAASTASPRPTPNMPAALGDPRLRESARVAASDVSARNGGLTVDDLSIRCADAVAEVTMIVAASSYRAGFAAPLCSPR